MHPYLYAIDIQDTPSGAQQIIVQTRIFELLLCDKNEMVAVAGLAASLYCIAVGCFTARCYMAILAVRHSVTLSIVVI